MGRAVLLLIPFAFAVYSQSRPQPVRVPSSHSASDHHRKSESRKTASASDAELEARIRGKLARSKLAQDKVTVTVRGGVATFEGETNVIQRKGSATRMARTAGATRVENHIRLTAEARQKAAANLAKGRRRAQVKRSQPRDGR